jgi:hypothetical protein
MESQPMRNHKLIQIPAIKGGKYPTRFCTVSQNIIRVLHPLYGVPLHPDTWNHTLKVSYKQCKILIYFFRGIFEVISFFR